MAQPKVIVRTWGPSALFTIPHFKAEPLTYPFPTPSAMKRLLASLYKKPEFEYEIEEIHVHKPIQYDTQMEKGVNSGSPWSEDSSRTLRTVTTLFDVEYTIVARIVTNRLRTSRSAGSYASEAHKRMRKGEEFRTPCFGERQHIARWSLIEDYGDIPPTEPLDLDYGPMLFDLRPVDIKGNNDKWQPLFFHATVRNGILTVPPDLYERERSHLMEVRNRIAKPARREVA